MFLDGFDFRILEMVVLLHRMEKGIDDRIAYDENGAVLLVFPEQVLSCRLRGSKVHIGQDTGKLAVCFFRIGRKEISRPKTRFHMAHFNLLVKSSQGCGKGGGGIAMDQYVVRFFPFQHLFQAPEHPGCDVIEGLSALHDIQVVVHRKLEEVHHLVQHFPMLGSEAYLRLDFPMLQQFLHHRRHLDSFRPGTKNRHYFHN